MDGGQTIDLRRRGVLLAGALAALAPVARASAATEAGFQPTANSAADVIVFCDRTLQHGLRKAGETFTAQTGAPVRLFSTSPRGMVAQIAHITQTDVLITQQPVMDGASAIIRPDTRTGAWRNSLVFAARAGEAPSASNLPEMLGDGRLAVTDPIADAPFDGRAILQQLGALDAVASRIDGTPDTKQAAFLVTSGAAKLALVYATDVRADPRLAVTALVSVPVPPYAAAVVTISRSPNAAGFVAFLRTPEATSALHDAGLEAA
ncbi:MAG TPA: substrate-binding domain-containing protein [Acidisphaera sp.]|nr:substrate-binding domain-containing protein [Acidisphaera sp.]